MTARTWLITGVSSGFGRELTSQLLDRGDRVIGATKWGIEGFCESVAQEVSPFGIGVTLVEPGG